MTNEFTMKVEKMLHFQDVLVAKKQDANYSQKNGYLHMDTHHQPYHLHQINSIIKTLVKKPKYLQMKFTKNRKQVRFVNLLLQNYYILRRMKATFKQ